MLDISHANPLLSNRLNLRTNKYPKDIDNNVALKDTYINAFRSLLLNKIDLNLPHERNYFINYLIFQFYPIHLIFLSKILRGCLKPIEINLKNN
jgi:hypothetical protein